MWQEGHSEYGHGRREYGIDWVQIGADGAFDGAGEGTWPIEIEGKDN